MNLYVAVISPFGRREIVSLDAYLSAPEKYVEATFARFLGRRELIAERVRARRQRR